MRKFEVGDVVRFRERVSTGLNYGLKADDKGTIVGVEDPPQTGPTYKIQVKFGEKVLPYIWENEFRVHDPHFRAPSLV